MLIGLKLIAPRFRVSRTISSGRTRMTTLAIVIIFLVSLLSVLPIVHNKINEISPLAFAAGPVAAYGFNEGSGSTTADASGNNNTGTLVGGVTWTTAGKYGSALSFNGSSSGVVTIPDSPTWKVSGLTGYTVSMWVNVKNVSADYRIALGKGSWPSDDIFIYKFGNQWGYNIRTTGWSCAGSSAGLAYLSAEDNTYHHIAVAMNASAGRCDFYSDGQIAGTDEYVSGTTVFATGAGLNNLHIGGLDGGQYLNADIDEVRVYTTALTQAEIQTDMSTPIGGTPPVISGVAAGSITTTRARITWATNEISNSQVDYGLTTAYGQSTTLDPTPVTAHSQSLSGLTSGTLYHYRVKSINAAGNLALSDDVSFTTVPTGDVTPPVITGVSSSALTHNTATISWTTDEPADNQVEYGLTTAYGSSTPLDSTLVTSHNQILSGLAANTLYYYRVRSKGASGNSSVSGDFTFTTAPLVVGFQETLITGELVTPTAMEFAPDGRLFVAEKSGTLRVIQNGQLLTTPFFSAPVAVEGEQGMLGIAFDPDFAVNQYVYVYYTVTTPSIHNRVSRLTANGNVAIPGSEVALLDLPSFGTSIAHQGGAIHFGLDGKLYIAVGDHQGPENVQLLTNPFGKMLRINSDGTIPTDNPFYNQSTGINRAIYAYGLRNPFTFAVDPTTGRIFVNDVGAAAWEEVNQIVAGGNFGWPICEGPQGTGTGSCNNPSFIYPLHAYSRGGSGEGAVTGGAFYRGNQFPSQYFGDYFFSDYTANWIRFLDSSNQVPGVNNPATSFRTAQLPVDLKVGPDGALYYLSIGFGAVYKIEYASGNLNPTAVISAKPTFGPAPLDVTFDASSSSDPDGDPLSYSWNFGDGTPAASGVSVAHTYQTQGPYIATLTVQDGRGGIGTATRTISVGTSPVATIVTPSEGTNYNAGNMIGYSGSATDAEDGALPASAYSWTIVFHHNTHTHPFLGPITGVTSGSFQIPQIGETAADVWYRIRLKVTDSHGLTNEVTRDIFPNVVTLTLSSNIPGASLTLDGQPATAPITTQSVIGLFRSIGASSPQSIGGKQYELISWSDGGSPSHTITTPAGPTTYTATFVEDTPVTSAWLFPLLQSAVTSGSGDNNGFEGAPSNLLIDDGVFATDTNSGTNTSSGCGNAGKDRHIVRDFNLTLPPMTTTVRGIEVRLETMAESSGNAPRLCAQLSWNGGLSYTSAKSTPTLTTRSRHTSWEA